MPRSNSVSGGRSVRRCAIAPNSVDGAGARRSGTRALPLRTLVPRKTTVGALAERRASAGRRARGRFSTGKLSPVSTASLTKQSVASRMHAVAGTRAPAESSTTSPGDDLLQWNGGRATRRGQPSYVPAPALAARPRPLWALYSRGVADRDTGDHDHEHDRRVDPFAAQCGGARGEHENEQQRVSNLPPDHVQPRARPTVSQPIGADRSEPTLSFDFERVRPGRIPDGSPGRGNPEPSTRPTRPSWPCRNAPSAPRPPTGRP